MLFKIINIDYLKFIYKIIPSIMSMILLSFYSAIDGFFVARYINSDAMASINIVLPAVCLIFGTAVMLATGSSAIIGELLGQKHDHKANQIFSQTVTFLLIIGIIITLISSINLDNLAILLGSSQQLFPYVLSYLNLTIIGIIPMLFKLYFEYLARTDNNPRISLIMAITGFILNICLDYLFICYFNLGILGAGLGTTISITISMLIGLVYFLKFSRLKFVKFKWDFLSLFKSITNGSSEMLIELSTGIVTFIFNLIVYKLYGDDGIAALTIIMYIYYFFISFFMGIAVATAPMISYNYGSKNVRKIKLILKYSFITLMITSISTILISIFGGQKIISIFVSSGNVFNISWQALNIFCWLFMFIGFNVFLSSYFTALGNGFISALISILRSLIFVVIFVVILPKLLGNNGFWLAMPASEILTLLVAFICYKLFPITYKDNSDIILDV